MHKLILSFLLAAAAHAVTLPSTFESDATGLNVAGPLADGWAVTPTIDVVAPGYFIDTCNAGSQRCLDMTGTTGASGAIGGTWAGSPHEWYTVSFWLSGSQRNLGFNSLEDTVRLTLNGDWLEYTLIWSAPWQHFEQHVQADGAGNVAIEFAGLGDDNVGLILDDISIQPQQTPEPVGYALLGLALIAAGRRLR